MGMPSAVQVSCLCGNTNQTIRPRLLQDTSSVLLSLCHCDTCRHVSGLLCTSYYPIKEPVSLDGTRRHDSEDGFTRYFCSVCGCHVFRWGETAGWEVATGVIKGTANGDENRAQHATFERHHGVSDTRDGGIAKWIPKIDGKGIGMDESPSNSSSHGQSGGETLPASCACGTVKLHVTRPDDASLKPRSNFPDLMVPYYETEGSMVGNPSDEKWWLRQNRTKYLAGTCACRSCRLMSGFEIQTWAFVPRTNIFFHVKEGKEEAIVPLDFKTLPSGVLQSYQSSSGVLREFCGTCGATGFWHDEHRPDVVDISVGLFRAPEGARAENWLEWWTERVSFSEDAELDRWGGEAGRAKALIAGLEAGLKSGG
ncbi:Fc.00g075440.m01.CDS01 [Cosmosporella sp. VM-42]